jgi:hypothetical protein
VTCICGASDDGETAMRWLGVQRAVCSLAFGD